MNQLAIIIPAYKASFLAASLESITSQTCKDFTLYIGDDCSPYDLESIVKKHQDKINIVYKRFEANLGAKDLVAQWERCIDLNQGEEWLWLFSDDDIMAPNCVEDFYKTQKKHPEDKLFHFNINVINADGKLLHSSEQWPEHCTTKRYLDGKLSAKGFITYVVEFIIHRDIFFGAGRFQNYDLAWGSDFVSWVKFSNLNNGICTISDARISWRDSGENISPNHNSNIIYRKMKSVIRSVKFITDFAKIHHYGRPWFYGKYALGEIRRNRDILSKQQLSSLSDDYNQVNHFKFPLSFMSKILFRK